MAFAVWIYNINMYIAIAGNIGSGKTTLAELLAKHYGYKVLREATNDNPYLASFYEDMRRWSFNLQIYFLRTRFQQLLDIKRSGASFIQDRTLYEDAYIFAPNLNDMGLLNTRDYENYRALFDLMEEFIQPPDLLIYLRGDVPALIRQIQRRGREYEGSISLDYLSKLNDRYDKWIQTYNKGKLLTVDIEQYNFADMPEDLGHVIDRIDAEFNGLFDTAEMYEDRPSRLSETPTLFDNETYNDHE